MYKIPSMKVTDIARAINPEARHEIIGIRPGEKIHEVMISEEDAMSACEYDWYYKILPTLNQWHLDEKRIKDGKKVEQGFVYSSSYNQEWMSIKQLKEFLKLEVGLDDQFWGPARLVVCLYD